MTDQPQTAVCDIVQRAEKVPDWREELVAACRETPGAAFEPEVFDQIERLRADNRAAFENLRAQLKKAGVRVSELDDALKAQHCDDTASNTALDLFEPEPWPDPIDGGELLEEIVAMLRRYLAIDEEAATAIALWVLHAHALDAAYISPRLAFTSPEKRCGKTTALAVVQQFVPKPLPAANITTAVVFRVIEARRPTLLIDEADTFLPDNSELRGVLNSGHNKATAVVWRAVGEDHTPTPFSTWSPVAIALIGHLPDTLADRAIDIKMRRKRPDEVIERLRFDRVEHLHDLCRKSARWVADNIQAISACEVEIPETLHDRAADNWRLMLAIADTIGGRWPVAARHAAKVLSGTDGDEESAGVLLLRDIAAVFDAAGQDHLPTISILEQLHQMEERPWPEWRNGKPITPRQLARLLKPFGIAPNTIRVGRGTRDTPKGYKRTAFEDAFSRYTPSQSATTPQPAESKGSSPDPSATTSKDVADTKPGKPRENKGCGGVAAEPAPAHPEPHSEGHQEPIGHMPAPNSGALPMPDLPHPLRVENRRKVEI